jgi:hypothetical protein
MARSKQVLAFRTVAETPDPALEALRDEARYRRERLDLYRAKTYAGRADNASRLRELQRASDGAEARLRAFRAAAS